MRRLHHHQQGRRRRLQQAACLALGIVLAAGNGALVAAGIEAVPEGDIYLGDGDVAKLEALIRAVADTGAATAGAAMGLSGRRSTALSPGEVTERAAARSLFVRAQQGRYEQSAFGVTAAESVFDPTFAWSVREARSEFNGRTAVIRRSREKVVDFEQLEEDFNTIADGGTPIDSDICVIVDDELVNGDACQSTTEISTQVEFASFASDDRDTLNLRLDGSKSMRWGGVLAFGIGVQEREKFGYSFGTLDGPLSAADPVGNGSRYEWTSSASLSFSAPLPYSRNFGPKGNPDSVNAILAGQVRERSRWEFGSATNSVLADAQRRYWELVRRALEFQASRRHRETMNEHLEHARRVFESGQITQYELRQVEATLERFRNLEEIAWRDYVKSSNALIELLDLGRDEYIVPTGYAEALQAVYEIDMATAVTGSLDGHPDIRISAVDLAASDVVSENSRLQTRPDLSLVVGYTTTQSDAVLGYRDPFWSLGNIIDPDQDDLFIGIFYRLPFGNRSLEAALGQARAANQQARDRLEQTRIRITEQVNAALSALYARRSEVDLTRLNLRLADEAYQTGARLREAGNVTEFDLLQTFDTLLDARLAHVRALTAYQSAWVDLSEAQGRLASYPQ